MQEGLLSVAQAGDSDLLGGRAHRTANWASFICNMLHTVIGYMFAKQSYWYKLRGLLFKFKAILLVRGLLFKFKAILLVQTAQAFFKLRRLQAAFFKLRRLQASQLSRGLFTGCTLIGRLQVTRWGRGIPPFHGNETQVLAPCQPWPPASPSPGSPT